MKEQKYLQGTSLKKLLCEVFNDKYPIISLFGTYNKNKLSNFNKSFFYIG